MIYTPLQIKPVPVNLKLKGGRLLKVTEVLISDAEYDMCYKQSYNMWSSKKKGVYGKGLLNSASDPCKVERLGLLGEMAMCKCINRPINLDYIEHGDGGSDLTIADCKFDIKTASYNYEMVCIQVRNEYGVDIKKNVDGYIAAFLKNEMVSEKKAVIVIVGYQMKEFIDSLPIVPARKGKHFNKELRFIDLIPFYKKYENKNNVC